MKSKHQLKLLTAICCIMLLAPLTTNAQRGGRILRFENRLEHDHRPYHFGFSLGLNTMNYAVRTVENLETAHNFEYVLPEPNYGFHIGIVSNLKINDYLDLRFIPAISFGDRFLEYYMPAGNGNTWHRNPDTDQDFEVTMLEFPLHMKYKSARMTNTRAYVLGGFKYTHDLASIELGVGDNILARVGRNDIHYEVGVGFDHYFFYFKFAAELKASFGITNLIRPGEEATRYYDSIDRLNARSILISFTFE